MFTPATIKAIQDIMRQDVGVDGDAQRLSQMIWLIFLKILDDEDRAMEIRRDKFVPTLPEAYQWRTWAAPADGITGDTLITFVNDKLIPKLRELPENGNKRTRIARTAFQDIYNFMRKGTLLRQVINKINDIDFTSSTDRHVFNDLYERLLKTLQSAGNFGEMYTPRAVTQFVVEMVDPQLGDTVLDPAAGTGGFLVNSLEHMRKKVKSITDEKRAQESVFGVEKKPLPYMLLLTNMMLHGVEEPVNMRRGNTLERPLVDYTDVDKVTCIITNPPFGGTEEPGIEKNFPREFQTRETADLFLILIMRLLKKGGRGGVVLPDPTLFGEGMKTALKKTLLQECNLHTIVRLPKTVFAPYTNIATNLLFFTKGEPTKEIWYYEHSMPIGQKAYSKTNPMRGEEFILEKQWWNQRVENEHAWKVTIEEIRARNFNLDIKNPNTTREIIETPKELLEAFWKNISRADGIVKSLKRLLAESLSQTGEISGETKFLLDHLEDFVRIPSGVNRLSDITLILALSGKLVPQDLDGETADGLYKLIQEKHSHVVKNGTWRKKKEKAQLSIEIKDITFDIPKSWRWVRGVELFEVVRGVTYGKEDVSDGPLKGYLPLLRSHNIQEIGLNTEDLVFVKKDKISPEQMLKKGDILIAMSSGSKKLVGKAAQAMANIPYSYGAFCAVIRSKHSEISPFLGFFFSTPYYRDATALEGKGMGINNLTVGALESLVIPLPPLAEQKRIVAKVEEVIGLIRQLREIVEKNS